MTQDLQMAIKILQFNSLELKKFIEEEKKEKFKRIRFPEVLINQIYEVFVAVLEKEFKIKLRKDDQNLYRIFTMIQTDIPILQQNFEKESDNIKFLSEIVSSYISVKYSK
jgi:hypothetical protein